MHGAATAESLFFDDFESETVGQPPSNWNVTLQMPGTSALVGGFDASTKAVHFLDDGGGAVRIDHNFGPQAALLLEFDILSANAGTGYNAVHPSLRGDGVADWQAIMEDDGWIWLVEFGTWKVQLLEYEQDTWYHVRRTLNLMTNTGLIEIKQRDDPNATYSSYVAGPSGNNTYFDRFDLWTAGGPSSDSWVDNVRVSRIPCPSTFVGLVSMAVMGLLIARRRYRRS